MFKDFQSKLLISNMFKSKCLKDHIATLQRHRPQKMRTNAGPKSRTPERHAIGRIGTMVLRPLELLQSNLRESQGVTGSPQLRLF